MARQKTELGKYLYFLRMENDEFLKDMAEKLFVSSAFLSAVESNRKKIPDYFEEMIIKIYNLSDEQADELKTAIMLSRKKYIVDLDDMDVDKKKLFFGFLSILETLDNNDVKKIEKFLKNFNSHIDFF